MLQFFFSFFFALHPNPEVNGVAYYYDIKNETTGQIALIYSRGVGNSYSVVIERNQHTSLFSEHFRESRVYDFQRTGSTLRGFTRIQVYMADTLVSKIDLMKTPLWTFKKSNRWEAHYTAVVSNSDL